MFADLKKQLSSVEMKLRGVVSDARGKVAPLKKDVQNVDKEFLGAFDRLSGIIKKTEQTVTQRIGSVEASIRKLAPPK